MLINNKQLFFIGGKVLDSENYLELLERKFTKHFQIERNKRLYGEDIEMYCRCNMRMGRTLITKNDVIDCFETNEYILIKSFNVFDSRSMFDFVSLLNKFLEEYIRPNREHRSTQIYGVMVCNDSDIPDTLLTKIKHFKHEKIYKFYLHGFASIKLVLVNLNSHEVITSKGAKEVKKVYLPTP